MNNNQGDIGGTPNTQTDGTIKYEHVGETATFTSNPFTTADARALEIEIVTRTIGTGDITVSIERLDKSSNTWILVLAGTNITTNTTNRYRVSPELTAAANLVAQDHLPEIFRVKVTHNNANATTYSLSYHLAQ